MKLNPVILAFLFILGCMTAALSAPFVPQAFRAKGQAVQPAPDGSYFCEAEEFRILTPGWRALPWGENSAYGTCANTFLSRKAFLGAPAQCRETTAAIDVDIKEAGRYLVLIRHEAPYRFEARFQVRIQQHGATVFDRQYGARQNIKIWWRSTTERLVNERANNQAIVWEGHDAFVPLQPGRATITLTAGPQPEDAAPRNVDLVMLTRDEAQVKMRLEKSSRYLPLDGWLTQQGDVWMKVTNPGEKKVTVKSLSFPGGPFQQHSPYWVHIRNWQPVSVEVEPGRTTEWIEVGSTIDALNDGQWGFNSSGPCRLEFGLMNADGKIESLRTFRDVNGNLPLVGLADVRYSRRIPTAPELNGEILAFLNKLAPTLHGKPPSSTLFFASGGWAPAEWQTMQDLYGLNGRYLTGPKAMVSWHGLTLDQLKAELEKIPAADRPGVACASLGDEMSPSAPSATEAANGFVPYLKEQGLTPDEVNPAARGDWSKVAYDLDPATAKANPRQYYWSWRYRYQYGIRNWKAQTDLVRQYLPNAEVGLNFSPHAGPDHAYLGNTYHWITLFREGGLTQAWSEDWAWQVSIGTQQMNSINPDLFRAGLRHHPERRIQYYVMAHVPGNNPNSWRRMFFSVMGHGAKVFNLFELDPVWCAYTENHVTSNAMYAQVLRTLYEYGTYEDIVQAGQVRPADVGLWFSETGDIWQDSLPPFAAGKRGLYIGILHQQVPLDILVEPDALDGTLNQYRVLYLADQHVSRAASEKIAAWVRNGGTLFATAGAGMFDEYNQPNTVLRALMGVEQREMTVQEKPVEFIKSDLPFTPPLDTVTYGTVKIPVFGAVSRITPAPGLRTDAVFADGSPAIVRNTAGAGKTIYCAFLPSLSYFKPAVRKMPMDLNSRENSMSHYIPTQFDRNARTVIGLPLAGHLRPVTSNEPLVEASILEAKAGTAIVLNNWSGKPVKNLRITIGIALPARNATLGSGKRVTVQQDGKRTIATLDLEAAGDVIIFR